MVRTEARRVQAFAPILALLLGGLGPLVLPSAAAACTYQFLEPEKHADVIVVGVAVDRRPGDALMAAIWPLQDDEPFGDVEYVIALETVERGDVGPLASTIGLGVHMRGGPDGTCGQSLVLGARYRIAAEREDGRLTVGLGWIEELPPLGSPPTIAFAGVPGWLTLPGAIVVLAIGGFFWVRAMVARRRHSDASQAAGGSGQGPDRRAS